MYMYMHVLCRSVFVHVVNSLDTNNKTSSEKKERLKPVEYAYENIPNLQDKLYTRGIIN